jgi:hypothetical protein
VPPPAYLTLEEVLVPSAAARRELEVPLFAVASDQQEARHRVRGLLPRRRPMAAEEGRRRRHRRRRTVGGEVAEAAHHEGQADQHSTNEGEGNGSRSWFWLLCCCEFSGSDEDERGILHRRDGEFGLVDGGDAAADHNPLPILSTWNPFGRYF